MTIIYRDNFSVSGWKDLCQQLEITTDISSIALTVHLSDTIDGEDDFRICTKTGEKMLSGWCVNDGDEYYKNMNDANQRCIEAGYKDMQQAFDDGFMYWTEWNN